MEEIELVVKLDQETLQDLYDSRYVSPHIKEVFRSATRIPKGHGDIVDIEKLADRFWDGNSMEITKDDLARIEPIIKADTAEGGE